MDLETPRPRGFLRCSGVRQMIKRHEAASGAYRRGRSGDQHADLYGGAIARTLKKPYPGDIIGLRQPHRHHSIGDTFNPGRDDEVHRYSELRSRLNNRRAPPGRDPLKQKQLLKGRGSAL